MIHVPIQTVVAKRDDGGRTMATHERDQLGVKFGDMVPSQIAVGIIADEDFGHVERCRRFADFEGPRVAQLVVFPRVDWAAAFAVSR